MNKAVYNEVTSRLPLKERDFLETKQAMFVYPHSTSRDDIVQWIIGSQFVDYYVIKLIGNDDTSVDDVIQDIYLSICEMTQEDWDRLSKQGFGAVRAYVAGMVYRQVHSCTSPSYYKYRRYNQNRVSLEDHFKNSEDYAE